MVQNRPDWQEVGREYLVPAGYQCVSFSFLLRSPFLPFSHGYATYLVNARSERPTHLCDAPDKRSSGGLPSPERDHLAPTSRVARRSRVLSLLHANPRRRLPNGHPQPNRPLPGRIQRQRPGHLRSERVHTRSALRLSRSACVEPRVARGHDWRVVGERLLALRIRVLVLIAVVYVYWEKCQVNIHEWFWPHELHARHPRRLSLFLVTHNLFLTSFHLVTDDKRCYPTRLLDLELLSP